MRITSAENKKLKEARRLLEEREALILEGEKLVLELLERKRGIIFLFLADDEDFSEVVKKAENIGIEPIFMPRRLFKKISDLKTPPGVALIYEKPRWKERITTDYKALLLDRVQDPTNVGTILRSAYSFGVNAVYLSEGCASPWGEKVVRASAGAVIRLPVFERQNLEKKLEEFTKREFKILGAYPEGGFAPWGVDLTPPWALVVGNESRGISPELLRFITTKITIPMKKGESLNVAVSASIILYEFARQGVRK